MDEKAALEKIQRLSVGEKMAQFSDTDMVYVETCIEQAIAEEQAVKADTAIKGADKLSGGQ